MGFTVRFMIGTVLVLLCCWSIETTSRQIRQTHNESTPADKLQKIEDEKTTPQSIVANLSEESTKPKTDFSTEDNTTLDKENSLSKLQKSETYKKATNQPEIKTTREEIARSIDIEKYVSKEFHNKNNVYTLPLSPDTQKYVDSDYNFHGSTPHDHEHTKDFHFDAELTTPKSLIFDHKFKEAVESVDQKLEHIDDSHELSSESESKESLNLEKLYDETKSNDTKANLNYINYKNITSNDTAGKNSLHKDLVVEAGTKLDFHSTYNETVLIDENDDGNNTVAKISPKDDKTETTTISNTIPAKGDLEKGESSTVKSNLLTTRKSIVLTKPPSNKNTSQNPILSNNIETETIKAISRVQSTSEKPKGGQEDTPMDITKRGSIKFTDYAQASTQPTVSNEIKKKKEQMFQENQIVPVHVEAPPKMTTEKLETTTENSTEHNETTTSTNYVITTTETIFPTGTPDKIILATTEEDTSAYTTTDNIETTAFIATEETTAEVTTEPTLSKNETVSTTELLTITTEKLSATTDNPISTTELSTDDFSTTHFDTVTITETIPEANSSTNDFEKNITITTENIIRTSKGIVFRETVPTTEPIPVSTNEIPTTTEQEATTTEEIATNVELTQTQKEEKTFTATTEPYFINFENFTNVVPELKHNLQNETEPESTTENNTVSSDSYELSTIPPDDNSGTIAAITISSIGALCLILLVGLLFIMKKRQKRFNYGQRCTPVSLDDYSMDNISVYNSVRRKGMNRSSKRSYGNPAFEDPASVSHPLNFPALGKFANNLEDIKAEFEEIPQITARTNELPEGCDTKNRYANVIPLPETRVFLAPVEGCPNSDYINANYVTGPKNVKGYYIACQAPMQNTVDDFWRMIWEQQSKVVLMLTHLFENGVEKCVDYLPPSEVLDCHRAFGDFLITLKKREVKDKYIISILQLKNMVSSSWREITHFWYLGWPEKGVPSEANSLIAFLIEARSYMKSSSIDRKDVTNGNLTNGTTRNELNPVVVHCSPGTGRTGVVIACDIAIREFEQTRLVDVPRIVYKIRRDRASSVQTKEQYAFIYKVISLYATKLTGGALDSL